MVREVPVTQQTSAYNLPTPHDDSYSHPLNRRLCNCFYVGHTKPNYIRIAGIDDLNSWLATTPQAIRHRFEEP
jgi:hypothetical protein